jgi:hypothetical protein
LLGYNPGQASIPKAHTFLGTANRKKFAKTSSCSALDQQKRLSPLIGRGADEWAKATYTKIRLRRNEMSRTKSSDWARYRRKSWAYNVRRGGRLERISDEQLREIYGPPMRPGKVKTYSMPTEDQVLESLRTKLGAVVVEEIEHDDTTTSP